MLTKPFLVSWNGPLIMHHLHVSGVRVEHSIFYQKKYFVSFTRVLRQHLISEARDRDKKGSCNGHVSVKRIN